ncbi:sensor histidine kinase [Actinoplanes sp. CA-142083]|uniref:sensor histidine kinase n=1 Tax=Actinoplanes sp. CA-142083 TaxID=3239903 RepID=UPI003D8E4B42
MQLSWVSRQFETGAAATTRSRLMVDGLLALVLFGLTLLPLSAADSVTPWAYVAAAGQTLPLVLRRQSPLLANILIAPSAIAYGFAGWPSPLVPLGALVGLHAIAAYGSRAQSYFFLALALLGTPVVLLSRPAEAEPYEWLNVALAAGVAWLAGTLSRSRQREERQREERAAAERARHEAEAARAVAEERNRIAREMHDLLGHSVGVMVVLAEGAAARAETGDPSPETLERIAATGREAMTDLRAMLRQDDERRPLPTTDDLPALVETVREAGMTVELRSSLPGAVGGAVGLAVYRIVQEALTNARKHAPGEPVTVEIAEGPVVTVTNRAGNDLGRETGGRGLRNMRERAASIGAQLECGRDGETWRVTLRSGGADGADE